MLVSKTQLVYDIITHMALLYEAVLPAQSGAERTHRYGAALESYNANVDHDGASFGVEQSDQPAPVLAGQFLAWHYHGGPRPEWL